MAENPHERSAREIRFVDRGVRAVEAADRGRRMPVRALAISARFWQAAAAVSLAIHVWLTVQFDNPAIFPRCGALWVIVGGALVARPVIRKGYAKWDRGTIVLVDIAPTAEEVEERRQSELDALSVQFWGPVFAVLGTLIWGYGDIAAAAVLTRL